VDRKLLLVRYPDVDLIKQEELVAGGRRIIRAMGMQLLFTRRTRLLSRLRLYPPDAAAIEASSVVKQVFMQIDRPQIAAAKTTA
jgi:hypothetical protein